MDNISRRQSNEDTTTSMYLSFDAESTMSTACYKTLEAMSDTSALSCIDVNDSENLNNSEDIHTNSTLELQNNFPNISPFKTVKKVEFQDVKLNTPLRPLQKNILKEYKALCSTPSREQLLKTVDVTRGSDATRCADLGLAFLGVDDEKPPLFLPPSVMMLEENKENALPDSEEVSTLSACSCVEITTTVIEKKMLTSMSTVGSISEEEPVEEEKNAEKEKISFDMVDKTSNSYGSLVNNNNFVRKETECKTENLEKTSEANIEGIKYEGVIKKSETEKERSALDTELKIPSKNNMKSSGKPKIAVLTRNERRSICEPNLQTNKPSRISNFDNKRRSYLPTCKKSTISMDAEIEIPLLLNKMLKISHANSESKKNNNKEEKQQLNQENSAPAENIHSNLKKSQTSLIPAVAGNKRAFGFNPRMSVVVKTTLNSPARKISRRSLIGGPMSSFSRKSIIPQKTTSTDNSKIKQIDMLSLKNMTQKIPNVNNATQSNNKTLNPLKELSTKTFSQRKSLYPIAKSSEKVTDNTTSASSQNKLDNIYNCNVCKEKFRIKSLLDAHKRSHESDNKPPAFIKKASTTTEPAGSTVFGNSNQCKYCDKKFALLKALHIHLLQNCPKIPPSEKRKLQFTELNHVEKAQLPNVFSHHNLQRSASNTILSANETPRNISKQNNNTSNKSSVESLNKKKVVQKTRSDVLTTGNETNVTTTQNTAQKLRKISAHSGVYRTPSKSVPCHICKITFKSILDYTNHNLTRHSNFEESMADDADKAVAINNANIY